MIPTNHHHPQQSCQLDRLDGRRTREQPRSSIIIIIHHHHHHHHHPSSALSTTHIVWYVFIHLVVINDLLILLRVSSHSKYDDILHRRRVVAEGHEADVRLIIRLSGQEA
jgi:hypothetical protein